jgi:hypothetical protein
MVRRGAQAGGRLVGTVAAIKRKYHPQNLFHHNANIHPRRPASARTTGVTFPCLETIRGPVLLATDLAAAREFCHGKLGLQIDTENGNAIVFRCGNGAHTDRTESNVGIVGQQTQAAWQVSDIRAEVAELHARGIKAEGSDTQG